MRLAGGDHAALGHHDDAVGVVHHDLHVVLDEQERDALLAPQALHVVEQARAERRVDPGHRLVEQQEARLGHQRPGELEQLALPAGERARIVGDLVARSKTSSSSIARRAHLALAPAEAPAAEEQAREVLAGLVGSREQHVVEHGIAASAFVIWKVRTMPRGAIGGAAGRGSVAVEQRPRRSRRGRSPVIRLKNVVLPAPFGPIRAVIEPRSTSCWRRRRREAADGLRRSRDSTAAPVNSEDHLLPLAEQPLRAKAIRSIRIRPTITKRSAANCSAERELDHPGALEHDPEQQVPSATPQ